jgi:acetoacetate decarboxylase
MALLVAEQPCRETGSFMEAGILVQCMFDNPESGEEEVGVYFAQSFVDSDIALAAGREIWGYPRKLAKISLDLSGDTLNAKVVRNGNILLETNCELTDEGEWIDSGPNINAKVIPDVSGSGHSVLALTAAYLTYDIKNGRSGDVQIDFHGTPKNGLDTIEIESSMIGLYFDCDITVPAGKDIAKLEL